VVCCNKHSGMSGKALKFASRWGGKRGCWLGRRVCGSGARAWCTGQGQWTEGLACRFRGAVYPLSVKTLHACDRVRKRRIEVGCFLCIMRLVGDCRGVDSILSMQTRFMASFAETADIGPFYYHDVCGAIC
jgi:hypothetical protein